MDRPSLLVRKLVARELDLIVADTETVKGKPEFSTFPLPRQRGYFYCRTKHPLTYLADAKPKDILNYPLALPWMPEEMTAQLTTQLGLRRINFSDMSSGLVRCDNFHILNEIIASSDAVGVTTREMLINRNSNDLQLLTHIRLQLATNFGIIRLKRQAESPAGQLIDSYILSNFAAIK